jgi:hypothetical protein
MPRNNFLEQKYPLPICQGRDSWKWTDYVAWQGPEMPAGQWLYGKFTARRSDIEWTINTVRVGLEASERDGVLKAAFATMTPYLETFLVRVDGGEWRASGREFLWRLHGGVNRMEVRVQNTSGVLGGVTGVDVEFRGET